MNVGHDNLCHSVFQQWFHLRRHALTLGLVHCLLHLGIFQACAAHVFCVGLEHLGEEVLEQPVQIPVAYLVLAVWPCGVGKVLHVYLVWNHMPPLEDRHVRPPRRQYVVIIMREADVCALAAMTNIAAKMLLEAKRRPTEELDLPVVLGRDANLMAPSRGRPLPRKVFDPVLVDRIHAAVWCEVERQRIRCRVRPSETGRPRRDLVF